jgi:hypothetical protein
VTPQFQYSPTPGYWFVLLGSVLSIALIMGGVSPPKAQAGRPLAGAGATAFEAQKGQLATYASHASLDPADASDRDSRQGAEMRDEGVIHASYPAKSPRFRGVVVHPSSWRGVIFGSQLYVRIGADWCTGYRMPWIDRIHRIDQGERVILTTYVAYPWPSRPGKAELCGGLDLMLEEAVPIEMLGGAAAVYDGAVWPPVKRVSGLSGSTHRR